MTVAAAAWWLLVGHAVGDWALQSDTMGVMKNRDRGAEAFPWLAAEVPWFYWLTAHSIIMGGCVAVVLGPAYGVAEAALHWLVDLGKTRKVYGIAADQTLHLLCKAAWLWAAFGGHA